MTVIEIQIFSFHWMMKSNFGNIKTAQVFHHPMKAKNLNFNFIHSKGNFFTFKFSALGLNQESNFKFLQLGGIVILSINS